jgi:hypothetical protein
MVAVHITAPMTMALSTPRVALCSATIDRGWFEGFIAVSLGAG